MSFIENWIYLILQVWNLFQKFSVFYELWGLTIDTTMLSKSTKFKKWSEIYDDDETEKDSGADDDDVQTPSLVVKRIN